MIATFLFETGSALYVIWRYKFNNITRLSSAILVVLALFQLAEYIVCNQASLVWAKIGFAAITLLPALGLHLAASIAARKVVIVPAAYVSSLLFICTFLFVGSVMGGQVCNGNYVIFEVLPHISSLFALYYYSWLIVGVGMSIYWARGLARRRVIALHALAVGYLSFILPTTTVNLLDPTTVQGIPSIMCGFAVLLAAILTFRVVPNCARPI
jgi:hypothetical protein